MIGYGVLPKERLEVLPRVMINWTKKHKVIHVGWLMFYVFINNEKATK